MLETKIQKYQNINSDNTTTETSSPNPYEKMEKKIAIFD